jgi:hypothetical protein
VGILKRFFTGKGKSAVAYEMDVTKAGVYVNGVLLGAPLAMDDLIGVFGKPRYPQVAPDEDYRGHGDVAIWDSAGLKAFVMEDKTATLNLRLCTDKDWRPSFDLKKWQPAGIFTGKLLVDGAPLDEVEFEKGEYPLRKRTGNWAVYADEVENPSAERRFRDAEISYKAPRISTGKYQQKKIDGEPLCFKNLNFKLAIVQALMYDKELIAPKLDAWDFADDYAGREIDIDAEGDAPIPEIKKWFRDLQIDSRLAAELTELYLDGGNEVYMQVCPLWDGEDGVFDIKTISEAELAQFPNLAKITCDEGWLGRKALAALKAQGVEVCQPWASR